MNSTTAKTIAFNRAHERWWKDWNRGIKRPEPIDPRSRRKIYFIEAIGSCAIKIGIADEPERRLRDLQVASPHELIIRATIAGQGEMEERAMHRQFKHLHIRGEWFRADDELLDFIRKINERAERARSIQAERATA